MPTLPFVAEPIESMKARYPKCLERVWKLSELHHTRPGMSRDYVFDFESGLRLLISRSQFFDSGVKIHISASWENEQAINLDDATKQVAEGFRALGGKGILSFVGISPNRIPHWVVEQES